MKITLRERKNNSIMSFKFIFYSYMFFPRRKCIPPVISHKVIKFTRPFDSKLSIVFSTVVSHVVAQLRGVIVLPQSTGRQTHKTPVVFILYSLHHPIIYLSCAGRMCIYFDIRIVIMFCMHVMYVYVYAKELLNK